MFIEGINSELSGNEEPVEEQSDIYDISDLGFTIQRGDAVDPDEYGEGV